MVAQKSAPFQKSSFHGSFILCFSADLIVCNDAMQNSTLLHSTCSTSLAILHSKRMPPQTFFVKIQCLSEMPLRQAFFEHTFSL